MTSFLPKLSSGRWKAKCIIIISHNITINVINVATSVATSQYEQQHSE